MKNLVFGFLFTSTAVFAQQQLALSNAQVELSFVQEAGRWRAASVAARSADGKTIEFGRASGRYTVLYSKDKPEEKARDTSFAKSVAAAGEVHNANMEEKWGKVMNAVSLNEAGQAFDFFPDSGRAESNTELYFRHDLEVALAEARYVLDATYPSDIGVKITLTAKRAGYFSVATPTLATVASADLGWAVIPGYFQGKSIGDDFLRSYLYGFGLPNRPVVLRERTASTLASLLTDKSGATLAVVAEPGVAADPWEKDRNSRDVWKLGLSHMNRAAELSPTLYHPVLGEKGSWLEAGEKVTFRFRYVITAKDWFEVNRHVVEDVYRLGDSLARREPEISLTQRLQGLRRYVTDASTSLWRTEQFEGREIGAQSYLGNVVGARERGDSIKNSDYGAMWMLAKITNDPILKEARLPQARGFKLAQVQATPGFFQGAAVGQYYIPSSHRFAEEWGDYIEPVALTYYAAIDLGNILLFSPDDAEAKSRLRLSAERLLQWQKPDGSWAVAYNHATAKEEFTDLKDYRPTFYGLLVAYRIFGDARYLEAAKKGADWVIANSILEGKFLGVCGDVRFFPDFATAQIAQAMLDLYEKTHDKRYRDAAVETARLYTLSIYSHPVSSTETRWVNGAELPEWKINQAGLGFEHGGLMGSATNAGPILLATYAGLFMRIAELTGEKLFCDLARSAAVAREAFVDPATSVASYYWIGMNAGAGRFPHHAWWQVGWITDYLLSEASYRSQQAITFPRGFFTPKVGPHGTYGFAAGTVYGQPAELGWAEISVDNPAVDCVVARSTDSSKTFLILMNETGSTKEATISLPPTLIVNHRLTNVELISSDGKRTVLPADQTSWRLRVDGYGLNTIELKFHP